MKADQRHAIIAVAVKSSGKLGTAVFPHRVKMIPQSIKQFVKQQTTQPIKGFAPATSAEEPQVPYPAYCQRAIAAMLLSGRVKPKVDGSPNMTDVQPENAEVLEAIKSHPRLKNYLETKPPAGYLLIKSTSDPYHFVERCRELGFQVKSF